VDMQGPLLGTRTHASHTPSLELHSKTGGAMSALENATTRDVCDMRRGTVLTEPHAALNAHPILYLSLECGGLRKIPPGGFIAATYRAYNTGATVAQPSIAAFHRLIPPHEGDTGASGRGDPSLSAC